MDGAGALGEPGSARCQRESWPSRCAVVFNLDGCLVAVVWTRISQWSAWLWRTTLVVPSRTAQAKHRFDLGRHGQPGFFQVVVDPGCGERDPGAVEGVVKGERAVAADAPRTSASADG